MDFSPLTIIKSGKDKGDFPVSTSNKVKIPSRTFCRFLPRLPDHLHYWALEGGVYRNGLNIRHCAELSPLLQKLPDFKGQGQER